jgi:hypothetical protein
VIDLQRKWSEKPSPLCSFVPMQKTEKTWCSFSAHKNHNSTTRILQFQHQDYFYFTMKYALFLLALIVGSVSGTVLEVAAVTGIAQVVNGAFVTDAGGNGATCDPCVMANLYKRCVENPAVARGFLEERRELRGDRRLCPTVCPGSGYNGPGSWCYTMGCSLRRLTFADEHSERSLVVVDELQQAALVCYQEKAVEFPCLGVASVISVDLVYA